MVECTQLGPVPFQGFTANLPPKNIPHLLKRLLKRCSPRYRRRTRWTHLPGPPGTLRSWRSERSTSGFLTFVANGCSSAQPKKLEGQSGQTTKHSENRGAPHRLSVPNIKSKPSNPNFLSGHSGCKPATQSSRSAMRGMLM